MDGRASPGKQNRELAREARGRRSARSLLFLSLIKKQEARFECNRRKLKVALSTAPLSSFYPKKPPPPLRIIFPKKWQRRMEEWRVRRPPLHRERNWKWIRLSEL